MVRVKENCESELGYMEDGVVPSILQLSTSANKFMHLNYKGKPNQRRKSAWKWRNAWTNMFIHMLLLAVLSIFYTEVLFCFKSELLRAQLLLFHSFTVISKTGLACICTVMTIVDTSATHPSLLHVTDSDIIPDNFQFAISVCRLRESLSVCVCVSWLRIIEICSSLCDRTTALISHWD